MDTVWIENPETMQFVFKKDGSNPIAYRFGHPHLEGEEWEWFRGKVTLRVCRKDVGFIYLILDTQAVPEAHVGEGQH